MKGGVYKCIVCVKLDSGGAVSGSLYMCKLFFECVACVCMLLVMYLIVSSKSALLLSQLCLVVTLIHVSSMTTFSYNC